MCARRKREREGGQREMRRREMINTLNITRWSQMMDEFRQQYRRSSTDALDPTKARTISLSLFTRLPLVADKSRRGEGTTMLSHGHSSGASQSGKARDLHLNCNLRAYLPAARVYPMPNARARKAGRQDRGKEENRARRERSICSWVFFGPVGVVQPGGREDEEERQRLSAVGAGRPRCLLPLLLLLKTRCILGRRKRGK